MNPLFCDSENGDYTLAANSPLVGAGENGVNMGALDVGCTEQLFIEKEIISIPSDFTLHQNYPNPFNPKTQIQFDVATNTNVMVSIYNIMGQKVATLLDGDLNAGIYNLSWNGTSDDGIILPTGMYFYEMKSAEFHSVKKLIFVK